MYMRLGYLVLCGLTLIWQVTAELEDFGAGGSNKCECTPSCISVGVSQCNGRILPRSDCPCCKVCLSQKGESCEEFNSPCEKGLTCSSSKICEVEKICERDVQCSDDKFCIRNICADPCPLLQPCLQSSLKGGVCVTSNHVAQCNCPKYHKVNREQNICVPLQDKIKFGNDVDANEEKNIHVTLSKPKKKRLQFINTNHNSSTIILPATYGGVLHYKESKFGSEFSRLTANTGQTELQLTGLRPSTRYTLKWTGNGGSQDKIEIKTKDGCLQKLISYAVGSKWTEGCTKKCECLPEGQTKCQPRCIFVKGSIQDEQCREITSPSDPECCVEYACKNSSASKIEKIQKSKTLLGDVEAKLIVTSRTEDSITVAWEEFRDIKPDEGYIAEYRPLMPEKTSWMQQEVPQGPLPPTMTIENLKPNTVYEVRVSVNSKDKSQVAKTETRTVTTQKFDPCMKKECGENAHCEVSLESPELGKCSCDHGYFLDSDTNTCLLDENYTSNKKSCSFQGKQYSPGDVFYDGCQYKCTCDEHSEIDCQPRCQFNEDSKVSEGCKSFTDPEDRCCKLIVCNTTLKSSYNTLQSSSLDFDGCIYGNKTYNKNENFTIGCELKCLCMGYGDVSCFPRCPPVNNMTMAVGVKCATLTDPQDPCCTVRICDNATSEVMKDEEILVDDEIIMAGAKKSDNTTISKIVSTIKPKTNGTATIGQNIITTVSRSNVTTVINNATTPSSHIVNSTIMDKTISKHLQSSATNQTVISGKANVTNAITASTTKTMNDNKTSITPTLMKMNVSKTSITNTPSSTKMNVNKTSIIITPSSPKMNVNKTSIIITPSSQKMKVNKTSIIITPSSPKMKVNKTSIIITPSSTKMNVNKTSITTTPSSTKMNVNKTSITITPSSTKMNVNKTSITTSPSSTKMNVSKTSITTSPSSTKMNITSIPKITAHHTVNSLVNKTTTSPNNTIITIPAKKNISGQSIPRSSHSSIVSMVNATTIGIYPNITSIKNKNTIERKLRLDDVNLHVAHLDILDVHKMDAETIKIKVKVSQDIMAELLSFTSDPIIVSYSSDSNSWKNQSILIGGIEILSVNTISFSVHILNGAVPNMLRIYYKKAVSPIKLYKTPGSNDLLNPKTAFLKSKNMCQYKGKSYKIGKEFYDDCEKYCTCTEKAEVLCDKISCPEEFGLNIMEPGCLKWQNDTTYIPIPPRCCRRKPRCILHIEDLACTINGHTFDHLDVLPLEFIKCDQRCQCMKGHVDCENLCSSVQATPPFNLPCHPSKAVVVRNDGYPCCPVWKCSNASTANIFYPKLPTGGPHPGIPKPSKPSQKIFLPTIQDIGTNSVQFKFKIPQQFVGLPGGIYLRYTPSLNAKPNPLDWQSEVIHEDGITLSGANWLYQKTNLHPNSDYSMQVVLSSHLTKTEIVSPIFAVKTPGIATSPLPRLELNAALKVSEIKNISAKVNWRQFTDYELRYIDGIGVRYWPDGKKFPQEGPMLHRKADNYMLKDLKPDTGYTVDLIFLTHDGYSTNIFNTHNITFKTLPKPKDKYAFNISIKMGNITKKGVQIIYSGVTEPEGKYVNVFRVVYTTDGDLKDSHKFKVPKNQKEGFILLTDLKPGIAYEVWLEAYLTNGIKKKSNVVTIHTNPAELIKADSIAKGNVQEKEGTRYYTALIWVSVLAVLVCIAFIILITYIWKRQNHAKAQISSKASYDNPSYKGTGVGYGIEMNGMKSNGNSREETT